MSIVYRPKGLDADADVSQSVVITSNVSKQPFYFQRNGILQSSEAKQNRQENEKVRSYGSVLSGIYSSAKAWFTGSTLSDSQTVGSNSELSAVISPKHDPAKRTLNEESTPRKKVHLDSLSFGQEHLREQLEKSITPKKELLKFPKDPFNWDKCNTTTISDISPSKVQYGTRFYKRSRHNAQHSHSNALILKPSEEVSFLQDVFKGEYHVSPEVRIERENQLKLLSRDTDKTLSRNLSSSSNSNIIKLTERIKALLLENRKILGANDNRLDVDDVVIIKERKLDPLEEKRKQLYKQTLRFDRSLLTFEEEFRSYSQLIEERRKIVELACRKDTSHEKLIPDLSEEDLSTVKNTFNRSDNSVLSSKFMLEVTVRDFKTLAPRRWLNDTIIEFFMKYVEQSTPKTVAFNSFFYSTLAERGYKGVRRWMKRKKVEVLDLEKVIVPINLNDSHWTLAVIDNKQKKIFYLDSLSSGTSSVSFIIMKNLQAYLLEESKQQLGEDYEFCHLECPQQPNGYDCGIYVCLNTLFMSKNYSLSFDAKDAAKMRNYIGHLILSK